MQNYHNVEPVKPDYEIIKFYQSMQKQKLEVYDKSVLKSYLAYILAEDNRKQEYERELEILLELLEV